MPRKKGTRKRKENDENKDVPNKTIDSDSITMKKESFLRDFDMQVRQRLYNMEVKKKAMVKEITRMFSSEKLKVKKEIRQMTVKEFIEKGGNLRTFDFSCISSAAVCDISFVDTSDMNNGTIVKQPTAASTVTRSTRKTVANNYVQSPLVNDAPLTRTRGRGRNAIQHNLVTPALGRQNKMSMKTPLITPKFDPAQPLTAAREPKRGETLMSMAGSPVVQNSASTPESNLISLRMDKHQTLLGGLLFDDTMSPTTLNDNKERLMEVISALESRFGELSSQFSGQSSGLQVTNNSS